MFGGVDELTSRVFGMYMYVYVAFRILGVCSGSADSRGRCIDRCWRMNSRSIIGRVIMYRVAGGTYLSHLHKYKAENVDRSKGILHYI